MTCYVVLAIITWRNFEGDLRLVLWVFFGGLAVRTWIAAFRPED